MGIRMRKIILNIALSLDGYIAGPKGEFDWLFTDQDYGLRGFFSRVDTALIGRKTYDLMMKTGGAYPGIKNYVFSHKRPGVKKKNVVFVPDDIAGFINKRKAEMGRDIWLVGGANLVHSFFWPTSSMK
jgi:dihydrofolate reductase